MSTTNAAQKPVWGGAMTLPDGHRLFHNTNPARLPEQAAAIADDSGRFPEDTDDGVIWLDVTRCLHAARSGKGEFSAIPVIDKDGDRRVSPTDAATLLYLSREFRWTISDGDIFFYTAH